MLGKKPPRVVLEGEWSLEKADGLQEVLAAALRGLSEADPRPAVVEVEMAEVSDIDACGCQLLAVFLENIRRQGITPVTCSITGQLRDKIAQIGFEALSQSEPQEKRAP